ncbi:lipoprotein, putative [Geotalea daltonii FRC-32]|uniref:Lipoprotein, putative n=1 Tax=Geotalea daltonii (strain DSM 22248 / JCM 15807 / FRC-32) TaxID=316067 RepID=B9M378_GEODF|nr:hypothetical protein [Geotalea daltonii]ACM19488.1 lipoprotein, putative [Geotalea daltonii FRC-32]
MLKILIPIIIIFLLSACGKKGPLVPPEALVPAAVADLHVAQKGDFFQLSWSQPTKEAGGGRLTGLAGFELFRREVLPPAEDCEQCQTAYRLLKKVDLDYLRVVDRLGNLLLVNDNGVETGKTYQYKVISRKKDGTPSPESNRARRQKVNPPLPPEVKATSQTTSILIELNPAQVEPAAVLSGYNIYRWRTGQSIPPIPLNDKPVTGNTFEDQRVERGVTYSYAVRTLVKAAGEEVESAPSNQVSGALAEPD